MDVELFSRAVEHIVLAGRQLPLGEWWPWTSRTQYARSLKVFAACGSASCSWPGEGSRRVGVLEPRCGRSHSHSACGHRANVARSPSALRKSSNGSIDSANSWRGVIPLCRRLMTVPGVGVVVALTYRTGVDAEPEALPRNRAMLERIFGLTPKRYSSGQTDL